MTAIINGSSPSITFSDGTTQASAGLTSSSALNASNITTGTLPAAQLPAGSVLQTVSATFTPEESTSSTSFVATTITVSITPTKSTSKILIFTQSVGRTTNNNATSFFTIYRNSTNLGGSDGITLVNESTGALWCGSNMVFLDSPTTTSATTYTVYFRASSGTAYSGWSPNMKAQITAQEIAA